ncbi:MAG: heterodisulfide reductase-related iron-sulfur binding cluster [Bacillota bacterium]|jgi:heterodisulfide reductase subunit B
MGFPREVLLYPGCLVAYRFPEYEKSAVFVLGRLGVSAAPLKEAVCCGSYLRGAGVGEDRLAAYNLALAAREGKPLVTLCGGCYNAFARVKARLAEDGAYRREINAFLAPLGLGCGGGEAAEHIVPFLAGEAAAVRNAVARPVPWRVGVVHPCSAFRPRRLFGEEAPARLKAWRGLCELCGASPLSYETEYECCGAGLYESAPEVGAALGKRRFNELRAADADCLVTSCGNCQLFLDRQRRRYDQGPPLPGVFITQLLALAMGADDEALGVGHPKVKRMVRQWRENATAAENA